MASVIHNHKTPNSVFIICVLGAIVVISISPHQALAKSGRPISEYEIREKKNQCYADVESGLWGWQCKSSMIAKENCALRCLSPACYELVYESDPLEEGEKDYTRSQEYKYCMHKFVVGTHAIKNWLVCASGSGMLIELLETFA